jgi:hypothetical protein
MNIIECMEGKVVFQSYISPLYNDPDKVAEHDCNHYRRQLNHTELLLFLVDHSRKAISGNSTGCVSV